jgi:hypothetical protein
VGPVPEQPPAGAHGEAKIRLAIDPRTGMVEVRANASWFTPDGEGSEAYLGVEGEADQLWELLQEVTVWLNRRWKRRVEMSSVPFLD